MERGGEVVRINMLMEVLWLLRKRCLGSSRVFKGGSEGDASSSLLRPVSGSR